MYRCLASKYTAMPLKIYHEDYNYEESIIPDVKSKVESETLKLPDKVIDLNLPEENIDLITVWQQALRGRAYQKQMLELVDKHKDTLDVLLSSQIKL